MDFLIFVPLNIAYLFLKFMFLYIMYLELFYIFTDFYSVINIIHSFFIGLCFMKK